MKIILLSLKTEFWERTVAAKKRGNIDYENISVEDLAQEVLVRAKSIFQNAKYRFVS